jgi:aspartate aminotransferase-like enzyme
MEAAVLNTCRPGDEIIAVNGGAFGARWRSIGERLGLTVHELTVQWGSAASVDEVRALVARHPSARAFCIQHSETSTTVLHPLEKILPEVKKISPHIVTIIDGISSCMTTPMPGSPATIDIYIAGSQKGFMLPPGLAMVFLSAHAWSIVDETPKRSLYFDLTLERASLAAGETSWTPASTIIVGLNAALDMFREEGLEVMYGRHALLARIAREGVITLRCRLLAPDAPGTSVTGFFPPDQVSADTLRTEVRKRFGIRLAGGQGKFKGAVVRIGHMGHVDPFEVMNTVLAIGMTARALGAKVDLEGASKVCLQLLAQ